MHLPPPRQTLLPPALPLLLPRSLRVPKRKPARPLIRARRLAHPRRIRAKQQSPSSKTKQRSVAEKSSRESETPPAHQLRVQVESRDRLESYGYGCGRFAQLIRSGCSRTAGRRPGVGAAA